MARWDNAQHPAVGDVADYLTNGIYYVNSYVGELKGLPAEAAVDGRWFGVLLVVGTGVYTFQLFLSSFGNADTGDHPALYFCKRERDIPAPWRKATTTMVETSSI